MTTDAPKEAQDALPPGQPSSDKPGEPSAQPETYTKEQAQKLADEKHSKLDKQVQTLTKETARQTAAIEAANRRAQAAEDSLAEAEKAKSTAELKAAGDNPDALAIFQAKQAVKEAWAEVKKAQDAIEAEKLAHASDIEDAKSHKVTKLAMEIATELNVDANQLLALTDGTEEKMRKAADVLPKLGQPQATKLPDSGDGYGGVKKLSDMSFDEINNLTSEQYIRLREEEEKEKRK